MPMSYKLLNAFNFILHAQGKSVTLEQYGGLSITVNAAPSNYFRNFTGSEEISIEGREFVISKKDLDDKGFPAPLRGDVIIDSDFGPNNISDVKELIILGVVAGYRVRTS